MSSEAEDAKGRSDARPPKASGLAAWREWFNAPGGPGEALNAIEDVEAALGREPLADDPTRYERGEGR